MSKAGEGRAARRVHHREGPSLGQSGMSETDWDNLEWLHVYGQYTYHGEATVRGTKSGLQKLREAIDAALASGDGEAAVMASDGEGYRIDVRCVSMHAELGTPEYIHEAHGRLLAEEAERARAYGLRNPFGKYRRVDEQ